MKKIVIAIDGFSSCGKSTMAKALARLIGYIYVDSGAMYRAVTLYALRHAMVDEAGNLDTEKLIASLPEIKIEFRRREGEQTAHTYLNGEDVEQQIRSMEVSSHVSPVAAVPQVREVLVRQQQAMGEAGGIVMDGRDIGTTVFPDAEMKVFVQASAEVRAHRRWLELENKGQQTPYEEVYDNVVKRDEIDMNRAVSPLRRADDATILDNGDLTPDEQTRRLMEIFTDKTK